MRIKRHEEPAVLKDQSNAFSYFRDEKSESCVSDVKKLKSDTFYTASN